MARPPINHQITFLYTPDLAKIAHFYEDVMGFPLKLDQGGCRIYAVAGDAYLGFCQVQNVNDPPAGQEPRVIMTIVTSDVDGWYRYLLDHGVAFAEPPAVNAKYNIYHCFLRDPDGNLIEIQRFLHPF